MIKNFTPLFLLILGACAVGQVRFQEIVTEKVKSKAAADFECDESKISIKKVDLRDYRADGCGKKANYIVPQSLACTPDARGEGYIRNDCTIVRQ